MLRLRRKCVVGLRFLLVALAVGLAAASFAGCEGGGPPAQDSNSVDHADPELPADDTVSDEIEVPDVVGDEGSSAVSDIEDTGLEAELVASSEDADIGEPRDDATDCTVMDQSPVGGEMTTENTVELSLDCRQADWNNSTGDEWDEYTSAYIDAAEQGCRDYFDLSPNGSLYDGDFEYSSIDCPAVSESDAERNEPADVPDDPSGDGSRDGYDFGCGAVLVEQGLSGLYYGDEYVTASDCSNGNSY